MLLVSHAGWIVDNAVRRAVHTADAVVSIGAAIAFCKRLASTYAAGGHVQAADLRVS